MVITKESPRINWNHPGIHQKSFTITQNWVLTPLYVILSHFQQLTLCVVIYMKFLLLLYVWFTRWGSPPLSPSSKNPAAKRGPKHFHGGGLNPTFEQIDKHRRFNNSMPAKSRAEKKGGVIINISMRGGGGLTPTFEQIDRERGCHKPKLLETIIYKVFFAETLKLCYHIFSSGLSFLPTTIPRLNR